MNFIHVNYNQRLKNILKNNVIIKYKQLKIDVKEFQKSAREKYFF